MQPTRHRGLIRQMLAAILSSNLSTAELRALARELRQGNLAEELSLLLEKILPLLADSSGSHTGAKSIDEIEGSHTGAKLIDEIEGLIRHKRLSKNALLNMMSSTGINQFEWVDGRMSARAIIERFVSEASSLQLRKLLDTIGSFGTTDEYLKGISGKRP